MTLYAQNIERPGRPKGRPGRLRLFTCGMYVYSTVKFTLKKSPVPDSDSLPV